MPTEQDWVTVQEYETAVLARIKAALRARIESGALSDLEWAEVLDAVLERAESITGTPALDAARPGWAQ